MTLKVLSNLSNSKIPSTTPGMGIDIPTECHANRVSSFCEETRPKPWPAGRGGHSTQVTPSVFLSYGQAGPSRSPRGCGRPPRWPLRRHSPAGAVTHSPSTQKEPPSPRLTARPENAGSGIFGPGAQRNSEPTARAAPPPLCTEARGPPGPSLARPAAGRGVTFPGHVVHLRDLRHLGGRPRDAEP